MEKINKYIEYFKRYSEECDWKIMALVKVCIFSIGLFIGLMCTGKKGFAKFIAFVSIAASLAYGVRDFMNKIAVYSEEE